VEIGAAANPRTVIVARSKGGLMEFKLKTISKNCVEKAVDKAEVYRYLNEPSEAESICRDILAVDPENQAALRLFGLAITDQFTGDQNDRVDEARSSFESISSPYEKLYYTGILLERSAKAQLDAGRAPHAVLALFEEAMYCFEEAEKIRPGDTDDAILRWNSCARLLQSSLEAERKSEESIVDASDSPPIQGRATIA
jgi:tetratricopeptide (TPR) repeat protein